jgi:hypothetical protein
MIYNTLENSCLSTLIIEHHVPNLIPLVYESSFDFFGIDFSESRRFDLLSRSHNSDELSPFLNLLAYLQPYEDHLIK